MNTDRSSVAPGMDVFGSDTHRVGEVKEVGEPGFVVSRTLQPDVTVPFDAIQAVTADGVVLTMSADDVDETYWVHAGEDAHIDLKGTYD